MSRCLLHITKIEEFKSWLTDQGIPHRPGKGFYQVIQVCKDGKHWNNIYTRHHMPEHFTNDRHLDSLVAKFCRERK